VISTARERAWSSRERVARPLQRTRLSKRIGPPVSDDSIGGARCRCISGGSRIRSRR
jgi:hypothetical protein